MGRKPKYESQEDRDQARQLYKKNYYEMNKALFRGYYVANNTRRKQERIEAKLVKFKTQLGDEAFKKVLEKVKV